MTKKQQSLRPVGLTDAEQALAKLEEAKAALKAQYRKVAEQFQADQAHLENDAHAWTVLSNRLAQDAELQILQDDLDFTLGGTLEEMMKIINVSAASAQRQLAALVEERKVSKEAQRFDALVQLREQQIEKRKAAQLSAIADAKTEMEKANRNARKSVDWPTLLVNAKAMVPEAKKLAHRGLKGEKAPRKVVHNTLLSLIAKDLVNRGFTQSMVVGKTTVNCELFDKYLAEIGNFADPAPVVNVQSGKQARKGNKGQRDRRHTDPERESAPEKVGMTATEEDMAAFMSSEGDGGSTMSAALTEAGLA